MEYPVVIHHEDDSAFGVTVPDIPGCFSAGDTMSDALHNVKEAINGHLEILAEDGEDIPQATTADSFFSVEDYSGGIWAIVDIDITPYLGKTVRINITLPEVVLNKIDHFVASHSEYASRSAFLSQVSLKEMGAILDTMTGMVIRHELFQLGVIGY